MKRKPALKEKQARGRENPPFPRTNQSRAPTTTTERQRERAWALLPCCGARNSLLAIRSQNFDRCHSPVAASSAPGGAAAGSPLHPHWFRASAVLYPNLHVFAHGSNTKSSVVLHCFSHHRGFVIGARLKRKSGRTKKPFPSRRKVFFFGIVAFRIIAESIAKSFSISPPQLKTTFSTFSIIISSLPNEQFLK